MKKLIIHLDVSAIDIEQFIRAVSFISEDIIECKKNNQDIEFLISDAAEQEELKDKIIEFLKKFISVRQDECIYLFSNNDKKNYMDIQDNIISFDDGLIGMSEETLLLFRYFDSCFREMAINLGAQEKIYPVLLPTHAYRKTGYPKNSPQYSMFCCCPFENMDVLESINERLDKQQVGEILNEPMYVLSPSACFHTYLEYENRRLENPSIFTFSQSVFRNEGRLNYSEVGRLKNYHVREIVFVGTNEYVISMRKKIMNSVIKIVEQLKLEGDISIASDPFIMPKLQKHKKIQQLEKMKYEMHLNYEKRKKMSVASFNLHGTAFTKPFNISVKNVFTPITGCVGFGIERWVIAFLCQYGNNIDNWPDEIKNSGGIRNV